MKTLTVLLAILTLSCATTRTASTTGDGADDELRAICRDDLARRANLDLTTFGLARSTLGDKARTGPWKCVPRDLVTDYSRMRKFTCADDGSAWLPVAYDAPSPPAIGGLDPIGDQELDLRVARNVPKLACEQWGRRAQVDKRIDEAALAYAAACRAQDESACVSLFELARSSLQEPARSQAIVSACTEGLLSACELAASEAVSQGPEGAARAALYWRYGCADGNGRASCAHLGFVYESGAIAGAAVLQKPDPWATEFHFVDAQVNGERCDKQEKDPRSHATPELHKDACAVRTAANERLADVYVARGQVGTAAKLYEWCQTPSCDDKLRRLEADPRAAAALQKEMDEHRRDTDELREERRREQQERQEQEAQRQQREQERADRAWQEGRASQQKRMQTIDETFRQQQQRGATATASPEQGGTRRGSPQRTAPPVQSQTQLSAQADSLDQGHDYDYSVATAERAAQTTCRHNLMAQCSDGRLSSVTFGKTFYGEKKNEQGRALYHATSTCSGACLRSQAAP